VKIQRRAHSVPDIKYGARAGLLPGALRAYDRVQIIGQLQGAETDQEETP
jgi:hypothetical protein